jgi:hypothetical protein
VRVNGTPAAAVFLTISRQVWQNVAKDARAQIADGQDKLLAAMAELDAIDIQIAAARLAVAAAIPDSTRGDTAS